MTKCYECLSTDIEIRKNQTLFGAGKIMLKTDKAVVIHGVEIHHCQQCGEDAWIFDCLSPMTDLLQQKFSRGDDPIEVSFDSATRTWS